MHLKRFRGQTVADALGAAREELGSSALVLSTRLVPKTGWRGLFGSREVEVTAATDRPGANEVSEDRPQRQADRHPARPIQGAVQAQLRAAGLDAGVVEAVAAGFGRRLRPVSPEEIRRALTAWAADIAAPADDRARVEVFLGPTGAGKTTMVAKLAAHGRIASGRRVRLVSTDTLRVGATEQLRLYAEIIGLPFAAARTPGELAAALTDGTMPVFVDTAGRPPTDGPARDALSLLASTPDVRVHFVVPAVITPSTLGRLLDGYAEIAPERLIVTKMDEGGSIAPLAGLIRARGLRISYFGAGQQVPEDLYQATPAAIAAALVGDALAGSEHAA